MIRQLNPTFSTAAVTTFVIGFFLASSLSLAAVDYLDPNGGWRYTYEGEFLAGVPDNDCIGLCPAGFGGNIGTGGAGADFNDNKTVEGADFLIWQQNEGTTSTYPEIVPKPNGNANMDLDVNWRDLSIWEHQYGVWDPNFDNEVLALDGTFRHDQGDKWDGTAPGDTLSDPNYSASPAVSLTGRQGTSPGGAGRFLEGNTDYIRIQDAGNPEVHGWIQGLTDPNLAVPLGCTGDCYPTEGLEPPAEPINTNRRVYFGHDITQDFDPNDPLTNELIMTSTGVTVSFRVRIPNSGPLDDVYSEVDGDDPDSDPDVIPWFQDAPNGRGKAMTNNRGMINIVQNDPTNVDTLVGFSLVTSSDIKEFCELNPGGSLCTDTDPNNPVGGLIMNNLNGNAPSDFIDSTSGGSLNILEIPDNELNEWNEFWITLENNGGLDGNIEVNVYRNGSTSPQTFQVTLAAGNNASYAQEDNPFLEFGVSDNADHGSFDMDYISYKIGKHIPVAALSAAAVVPEPSSLAFVAVGACGLACIRRRRTA